MVSVYPPVGHHLVDSNNGTMITSPLISNVSGCLGFLILIDLVQLVSKLGFFRGFQEC